MPPDFTRDIQLALLENSENLRTGLHLRGYHPLWHGFPANFDYPGPGVNWSVTPHLPNLSKGDSVCSVPRSIAFTNGISVDFFSCGY